MALRTDKNLRAGLYARVSTEDRGQDPETQLRPLREYADRRGFSVVGEFVDHASGATETRPRYQKLLEAARKRELDVVLVWCAERFIRTLKENLLRARRFETVEELRLAPPALQGDLNRTWIIERHGYRTPAQVRAAQLEQGPMAA